MSDIQNVETSNKPEIGSNNSFETPIIDKVDIPESSPEPTEERALIESAPAESGEGELPEFAKRRLGKEQKKYERELSRLRAELEEARKGASQAPMQSSYGAQSQSGYIDPITQKYIDVSTPEGQLIYNYQQAMSQALTEQEKQTQIQQAKEMEYKLYDHIESSFDDAAERHSDFKEVMKNSGMSIPFAKELAYFPDPGELGYYLASNPQEVNRLQKLPPYEMKRELARHMAEMVQKNNITRAPTPIKPIGSGAANPAKHFAHKSIAELKAERKAQLSGAAKRR